jgi:hypothetical protein
MTAPRLRAIFAVSFAVLLLRGAPGLPQEPRVEIQLPAATEASGLGAGDGLPPAALWITYRHALLPPGQRLRLSVRAEGLESRSGISALSFTTANARGGLGLHGRLAGPEFVPVFEGHPLAVSGEVEVVWKIETSGPTRRAGRHDLVLRWRVDSVGGPEAAGALPPLPSPAAGSADPPAASDRPAALAPSRPDPSRLSPPPGLEARSPRP